MLLRPDLLEDLPFAVRAARLDEMDFMPFCSAHGNRQWFSNLSDVDMTAFISMNARKLCQAPVHLLMSAQGQKAAHAAPVNARTCQCCCLESTDSPVQKFTALR